MQVHVDESRADMRTGASAYLGLARVLLEEPVTKQAKRLFLAAVVAVVLLLARGLGRRRRRAVLGRGRVRRGLLFDILGAVRQHRDAAPRLLARWHLGLPLAVKARQRGARIAGRDPGTVEGGGARCTPVRARPRAAWASPLPAILPSWAPSRRRASSGGAAARSPAERSRLPAQTPDPQNCAQIWFRSDAFWHD